MPSRSRLRKSHRQIQSNSNESVCLFVPVFVLPFIRLSIDSKPADVVSGFRGEWKTYVIVLGDSHNLKRSSSLGPVL